MISFLILYPDFFWQHKSALGRRNAIDELMNRKNVRAHLTGQGWSDWNDKETLRQNIDRIMPDADVIFWYKPLGSEYEGTVYAKPIIEPKDSGGRVTLATYNEAFWEDQLAWRECNDTATQLVICHHKRDVKQFHKADEKWQPTVRWIPYGACESLFTAYSKPWDEREYDFVLTGRTYRAIYPVRNMFAAMISRKMLNGNAYHHPHPGKRLEGIEALRKQEVHYAKLLGNSKISLVCGSRFLYGSAKYVESAMAGACVAGDINEDYKETLLQQSLIVTTKKANVVADQLNKALASGEAQRKAELGQQTVRQNHTMKHYVDQLLEFVTPHVNAARR